MRLTDLEKYRARRAAKVAELEAQKAELVIRIQGHPEGNQQELFRMQGVLAAVERQLRWHAARTEVGLSPPGRRQRLPRGVTYGETSAEAMERVGDRLSRHKRTPYKRRYTPEVEIKL